MVPQNHRAEDLVAGVVAADVLTNEQQLAIARRQSGRVQAAGGLEELLALEEGLGQRVEDLASEESNGFDLGGEQPNRFERRLPA